MNIKLNIDPQSNTLKYLQLVDAIVCAVNQGDLSEGDWLPSVNELVSETSLSRDTIFKAYSELKNRGYVESVPNRGYFINRQTNKVMLFLDTYKAYKEVLYSAFRANLPDSISVDLLFHHYNIQIFRDIIEHSIGKYSKYIVMNFDHPQMKKLISMIPSDKLLIIDWNIHSTDEHSFVCQNFGSSLYALLSKEIELVKKYKRFIYVYPEKLTFHPKISIDNFKQFCSENTILHEVIYDIKNISIEKGDLYLLVSDRTLALLLDQIHEKEFEMGNEIGLISYNETPMKKYVKSGITVISTDFNLMGKLAAEYVVGGEPIRQTVPTSIIHRSSF